MDRFVKWLWSKFSGRFHLFSQEETDYFEIRPTVYVVDPVFLNYRNEGALSIK